MFLTSLALASTLLVSGQATAKPSPREKPDTAIAEGIRLLEAKQYEAFLTAFVPPQEQTRLGTTPEEKKAFAEEFGATKVTRLLNALKEAVVATPTFNADKTTATFPLKTPVISSTSLTLIKIGSYWYIANK